MRRGPKPKPTALHHLQGTFQQRHKGQVDAIAPGGVSLDEPPAGLAEDEVASWRFAVENAPAGILGTIDTGILRQWAIAEARFNRAKLAQEKLDLVAELPLLVKLKTGAFVVSPYVRLMEKTALLLMRLSEQLGFNPTARVGMGGVGADPGRETDNRWTALDEVRRKAANS